MSHSCQGSLTTSESSWSKPSGDQYLVDTTSTVRPLPRWSNSVSLSLVRLKATLTELTEGKTWHAEKKSVSGAISVLCANFSKSVPYLGFWSKSGQSRGGTSVFAVQVHFYVFFFNIFRMEHRYFFFSMSDDCTSLQWKQHLCKMADTRSFDRVLWSASIPSSTSTQHAARTTTVAHVMWCRVSESCLWPILQD